MAVRKLKKLKRKDINKNISQEKVHAINKIKNNEKKYTIILVLFFMVLFCIIGSVSIFLNRKFGGENVEVTTSKNYTSSGGVVVLTNEDAMSDEKGLKSKAYKISIGNNSEETLNYRLIFETDEAITNSCGCDGGIAIDKIKYSLNGTDANTLDSTATIKKGCLDKNKLEDVTVRLWVDDTSINDLAHFHGHFILKEMAE